MRPPLLSGVVNQTWTSISNCKHFSPIRPNAFSHYSGNSLATHNLGSPCMRIAVESRITPTPRALQAASLFDLDAAGFSKLVSDVDLPHAEKPWHVGLNTRRLFKDATWLDRLPHWPADRSALPGSPGPMPVREGQRRAPRRGV